MREQGVARNAERENVTKAIPQTGVAEPLRRRGAPPSIHLI